MRLLRLGRINRRLAAAGSAAGLALALFLGAALLMSHTLACCWVFVAALRSPDFRGTWVEEAGERGGGGRRHLGDLHATCAKTLCAGMCALGRWGVCSALGA